MWKNMKSFDTSLYFITDSTGLEEEAFLDKVERACKGGVTLLQLREKERGTREYLTLAEKVHKITAYYKIPLIIDDRADIAFAAGAGGVHLGQEDMPVFLARKMLGEGAIIGATVKTAEQAEEACRQGADYLGVGAIYPTTTKVKTVLTPVEMLKKICAVSTVPVNAIGGLTKDNLGILKDSGIDGICVVSAIMKAEEPERAARELREAYQRLKGAAE